MSAIPIKAALTRILAEVFVDVPSHYFLDTHEYFFATLAEIPAARASIPVGGKCATLAAQVTHTVTIGAN
jgi:hypothetical protein